MTNDQHSALTECATRLGVAYESRITAKACAISFEGAQTFTATFSVACRNLINAHARQLRYLRIRFVLRDLDSSQCVRCGNPFLEGSNGTCDSIDCTEVAQ